MINPLYREAKILAPIRTGFRVGASVVVGIVVGLLMVELRWFERTAYPLMVGSQAIPKIALAPIFVVWFGFGPFPCVLMTFLISFFPIVIATVTGLRSILIGAVAPSNS